MGDEDAELEQAARGQKANEEVAEDADDDDSLKMKRR
jgi:hypothetical protein